MKDQWVVSRQRSHLRVGSRSTACGLVNPAGLPDATGEPPCRPCHIRWNSGLYSDDGWYMTTTSQTSKKQHYRHMGKFHCSGGSRLQRVVRGKPTHEKCPACLDYLKSVGPVPEAGG